MRGSALLLGLCLAPASALGQTTLSGDAQVLGQLGVGTEVPQARVEVRLSSADAFALKVSSPDGSTLLLLDRAGKLGIGVASPAGNVDVRGSADSGDIGLQLRVGNSSGALDAAQVLFAYNSSETFTHAIRTQADASQYRGNQVLFYLWRSTGQPGAVGSLEALAIEGIPQASSASVHVLPPPGASAADVELEVSDGSTTGGGYLRAATHLTGSSRKIKQDISYLPGEAEKAAYGDVLALRHAEYRLKTPRQGRLERDESQPLARGLIWEDAPASIRGTGSSIVVNDRILNLELALKHVHKKIEALDAEIASLERGGGGP